MFVDCVGGRRAAPPVALPRMNHPRTHRCAAGKVSRKYRRLPRLCKFHDPGCCDLGDQVGGFVNRPAGHIKLLAVGKSCRHLQRQRVPRSGEHRHPGRYGDRLQVGRFVRILSGACPDPVQQDPIFRRPGLEAFFALVLHLERGLEKDFACRGFVDVHSPAGSQGLEI